jgi:hypothetical protein
MKTRALAIGGFLFLSGCGGSDAVIPDAAGGDGSPIAEAGGPDTSAGMDAGVDSGGMDAAGMDASGTDGGIRAIPGLALWLDANLGVTKNNQNQISQWDDQSGNANHATQGVANRQPIHTQSVINNLPTARFNQGTTNGMMMNIADSATLRWGTGDYLIEIVARFNNDPTSGTQTRAGLFWGKFPTGMMGGTGAIFLANNPIGMTPVAGLTGGIIGGNTFVAVSTSYNDNVARNYAYRRVGSAVELRVNGSNVATQNVNGTPNVDATGTVVRFGADFDASTNRLNGDIAEMIAVKGAISMNDLGTVETYLKTKYGL